MSEFSSECEAAPPPVEAPAPAPAEIQAEAPPPASQEVSQPVTAADAPPTEPIEASAQTEKAKEALSSEADGDVAARALNNEGVDSRALSDSATEKLQKEFASPGDGAAGDEIKAGSIRGESIEAMQADMATARERIGNERASQGVSDPYGELSNIPDVQEPASSSAYAGQGQGEVSNPYGEPDSPAAEAHGAVPRTDRDYSELRDMYPQPGGPPTSPGYPESEQTGPSGGSPIQEQFRAAADEVTKPKASEQSASGDQPPDPGPMREAPGGGPPPPPGGSAMPLGYPESEQAGPSGGSPIQEEFRAAAEEVTTRAPKQEKEPEEAELDYKRPDWNPPYHLRKPLTPKGP